MTERIDIDIIQMYNHIEMLSKYILFNIFNLTILGIEFYSVCKNIRWICLLYPLFEYNTLSTIHKNGLAISFLDFI